MNKHSHNINTLIINLILLHFYIFNIDTLNLINFNSGNIPVQNYICLRMYTLIVSILTTMELLSAILIFECSIINAM